MDAEINLTPDLNCDGAAQLHFSRLTAGWASRCATFDQRNFGKSAWPQTVWEQELRRADCHYLGLIGTPPPHQNFGQLLALGGVGYGIEAEILTIAVASEYRRRGIARALLTQLLQLAQNSGSAEVFLEVRAADQGAQKLYRAAGFAPVGLRKNYYSDDDGVIMRKILQN